jgi:hypothetical protein
VEDELSAYLDTYPGLIALVGNQIYNSELPPGTAAPYVAFIAEHTPDITHDGDNGFEEISLQVLSFAETSKVAAQVDAQVDAALAAWPAANAKVQACIPETRRAGLDESTQLKYKVCFYTVYYQN